MYMIFVLLGIFFSAFISDEDDYKVSFGYFMQVLQELWLFKSFLVVMHLLLA